MRRKEQKNKKIRKEQASVKQLTEVKPRIDVVPVHRGAVDRRILQPFPLDGSLYCHRWPLSILLLPAFSSSRARQQPLAEQLHHLSVFGWDSVVLVSGFFGPDTSTTLSLRGWSCSRGERRRGERRRRSRRRSGQVVVVSKLNCFPRLHHQQRPAGHLGLHRADRLATQRLRQPCRRCRERRSNDSRQ